MRGADADRNGVDLKPRISVFTLGVADLQQSLTFYREGLGLPTQGIVVREFEHGTLAFFEPPGGVKLAIWAQDDLSHDAGLSKHPVSSAAFTVRHNVLSLEDVDEVMHPAHRAGADVVKVAQRTFYGGYDRYFRNQNGHVWESV